ncbi:MAG: ribonuclease D, partial [Rhizobiales bacterium]|nr:ribonuclease D [Hyphomicrobiales bacterium]
MTTTAEVEQFCRELASEDHVAIDTEFMRDRTYWPKLCLVQLAGRSRFAAVDPLAEGIDLQPLFDLMADRSVVKVFHACRQDVEIFYHLTGMTPDPVFDTQLAAMVLGYGDEVGYDNLVTMIVKARIDKSSRFTDWSHRPLSEQQLTYALADVTHLRVIYEQLKAELDEAGRADWAAEELADLTSADTYEQPPELAWKRLKIRSKDPRFMAIAQALAAWREREAQSRDLPRNRIIRDDLLLEVAANRPTTQDEVLKIRRISVDKRSAAGIAAAIQEALDLPKNQLPSVPKPPKLPRGIGPVVDLLRVLLKYQCEEHQVAQRLVATTGDLEAIAADDQADVPRPSRLAPRGF